MFTHDGGTPKNQLKTIFLFCLLPLPFSKDTFMTRCRAEVTTLGKKNF
jgi:hypothetical protein